MIFDLKLPFLVSKLRFLAHFLVRKVLFCVEILIFSDDIDDFYEKVGSLRIFVNFYLINVDFRFSILVT